MKYNLPIFKNRRPKTGGSPFFMGCFANNGDSDNQQSPSLLATLGINSNCVNIPQLLVCRITTIHLGLRSCKQMLPFQNPIFSFKTDLMWRFFTF